MEFNIGYFKQSLKMAIQYAPVTIKLTVITFIVSLFLGTIIASIRHYKIPVLSQFFALFVTIYMGLPTMVALVIYNLVFMMGYADFASFFHIKKSISEIDPIVIAYFTLILGVGCHCSEITRGAFRGVENVQYEAGDSIGMTKMQTLCRIILPQMIPIMIPGLVNNLIGTLKLSNLASTIGVMEVMVAALEPCGETYSYLEGYVAAALVYWIIGAGIEWVSKKVEQYSSRFRKQLT